MSSGLHTYHKLRAFVVSQGSKITSTQWNLEQLRLIRQKGLAWKHLTYAEALIHIILGFGIVSTVAYAIPEVIHNPCRLTVFWMYIFTYLLLGFLTVLGLYQKSVATVKVVVTVFILLQVGVLLVTSKGLSQCKSLGKGAKSSGSPGSSGSLGSLDLFQDFSEVECKYSRFICNTILIPLFIHSFLFSAVLITYIFKFHPVELQQDDLILDTKKCHQFANIKIIIEEVP